MSTTYTDLVNNVKAYSGRTDSQTINAIPSFIAAAQTKLDATLRIPAMMETQSIEAAGLTLPLTFLQVDSVVIGEMQGEAFPYADVLAKRKVSTRLPYSMIYAVNGQNLELVQPADLIVTGWKAPQRLSSDVATNAYTAQAENALLWLSLSFLGIFARDQKAAQAWNELAGGEVQSLNDAAERFGAGSGIGGRGHAVRYF